MPNIERKTAKFKTFFSVKTELTFLHLPGFIYLTSKMCSERISVVYFNQCLGAKAGQICYFMFFKTLMQNQSKMRQKGHF